MKSLTFVVVAAMLWATEAVSQDSFQCLMKPGESETEWDRRLDASVKERIGCRNPSFLVRAIVAEGSYELIALDQSRITMCGWKTNLFEMFVLDRTGCIVKKKHRWQMNNIDAKRVRECFDGSR